MNVLSLFDGISCGAVALERAGIEINRYEAFEIDKYATYVSRKNFPIIEHHGNVFDGDFRKYRDFGLLLGGSPCFTKGNLVLTNKGLKPIEKIKIGDMVLTHRNRYRPVTQIGHKSADTWRIKFSDTPEFLVTENHPFYIREAKTKWDYDKEKGIKEFSDLQWKEVKDLTSNSYVASPIIQENKNPEHLTLTECYLLGLYFTNGKIVENKIHVFPKTNILSKISDSAISDNITRIISDNENEEVIINSKRLYRIINSYKLTKINEFILNLPSEQIKYIIDGIIDTTGKYSEKWDLWSIDTKDKVLAYSIGLLIQKAYKVAPHIFMQNNTLNAHYSVIFNSTENKKSLTKNIDDMIYAPFKYKKYNGIDTVYNISVDEDESYVINNKVVHNCTYWSIAKNNREVTPDGIGGQLFMQYVRALYESQCKYFIYENNYSIHTNIKDFISSQLGVQPIMINSALVSAQQRKRCYWTNIPNITQPNDKGIILRDILEGYEVGKQYEIEPKGCAMRGRYVKGSPKTTKQQIEIRKDNKTNAITTVSKDCLICEPIQSILLNNYVSKKYEEYAQVHGGEIPEFFNPYNKTNIIDKSPTVTTGVGSATTSSSVLVFQPIRVGEIGKGGQGQRIYSVRGKSVTLSANGGGQGAKTGLYKVDLPDGDYIIRKLTPIEAERLQTLQDNYTAFGIDENGKEVKISNTQRYKQIGNGWTVDVISHILSFLPDEYLTK